jgi:hypothetical protein
MDKYVLLGLIAAAVLVVCGLCYFVYNKYKTSNCVGDNCPIKKDETANCVGDVCTRPEVERVEPINTTSSVSDEDSIDSA